MSEEEAKALFKTFRDTCVSETSANDDDIVQAFHADETTSREGKCFLKCLYQKTGIVDETGAANMDFILKNMAAQMKWTPDQVEAVRTNCSRIEVTDPCEKAFALTTCLK